MEIVPLTAEYRKAWDDFCLHSPDAWFWHTTAWLDYNLAYRPELEPQSLSFLCKEGDRVMAVVPLFLEHHILNGERLRTFTLSGNPLPIPALPDGLTFVRRAKALGSIFSLIEGLAVEHDVAYCRFQVEPLSPAQLKPPYAPCNPLLRYGYTDCTTGTQLIDLRASEKELWEAVRRDHQRNINKAKGSLIIKIHSGRDLTDEKFDEYRLMHARAAGRVTRPKITFDMMRNWIQEGRGWMTEVLLADGKSVGFETFLDFKGSVYSMSACNEPGHENLPIRHLIQWESILWMRSHGYEFYEVGAQQFGALPYDFPEPKQLAISLFKGGFGGVTVPFVKGERFRNRDYWRKEQARRAELFAARNEWTTSADIEQAKALRDRIAASKRDPIARSEETAPIPDELRTLASTVIQENPDALQRHRNGSTKAVAFLVGAAMPRTRKGIDARIVRRAIEERLAQIIAQGKLVQ